MRVNTKDDPRYQKKPFVEYMSNVGRYMARLQEECGVPVVAWQVSELREWYDSGMSPLSAARKIVCRL